MFTTAPVAGSTVGSVNFNAENKRTTTVVIFDGVFANVFVVESEFSGTANDGYSRFVSLSNLTCEYGSMVSPIQFNKSHS